MIRVRYEVGFRSAHHAVVVQRKNNFRRTRQIQSIGGGLDGKKNEQTNRNKKESESYFEQGFYL